MAEEDDIVDPSRPPPGAAYTKSRSRRQAALGKVVGAAMAKELAELRSARGEAVMKPSLPSRKAPFQQDLSPRPRHASHARRARVVDDGSQSARSDEQPLEPQPQRAAAAQAASLQGATSRRTRLECAPPPVAWTPAAPPARGGVTYAQAEKAGQMIASTPAAAAAMISKMEGDGADAPGAAVCRAPHRSSAAGHRPTGFGGLVNGAAAVVMSDMEEVLLEAGVTADAMFAAGLTEGEARGLVQSLYAHSVGYVQVALPNARCSTATLTQPPTCRQTPSRCRPA